MGKDKLGRRGKLFKSQFGEDFHPDQLVIMAIDTAKSKPKARTFDYFVEPLGESFFFTPDERGTQQLLSVANETLKKTGKTQVIFGIENTGHYHQPIVAALRAQGSLIFPINAATTKEERRSMLDYSKTDDLDLFAIASAVAAGKVLFCQEQSLEEMHLQFLTRNRNSLVKERARYYESLHTLMDHYWPFIQGVPDVINGTPTINSIFDATWTRQSLSFLRHVNTPGQAINLGETGLNVLSKEKKLSLGQRRIKLILRSAELAPKVAPCLLQRYVDHLGDLLDNISQLSQQIETMERTIEEILAGTQGVLLLSVPQIGLVTAAEFMAEIGLKLSQYTSASAIIKLAGTNPVPNDSGNHHGQMRISRQGNKNLRSLDYMIGRNLTQGRGNLYFKAFAERLKGKHPKAVRIATGNKFMRVAFAMLTNKTLFAPPGWQGASLTMNPLAKFRPEFRAKAQETLTRLNVGF